MILTVEFPYEAHVILKRGRTSKRFILKSKVDVKVEEATAEQAPVALRWKPRHNDDPKGKMEVRWWDNCLWEPVYYRYSGRPDLHVSAETLTEMVKENRPYANPLSIGHDWQMQRLSETERMEDLEVRTIVSSEREKAMAQVQACAAGTLIVDGMVYRRSDEPVYVVHPGFEYSYVDVESLDSAKAGRRPELVFRADRWEDALAAMQKNPGDEVDEDKSAPIEILIPEVLKYDDETPAIIAVAVSAADYMGGRLKEATKEFMSAYADLRDTLKDGRPVEPDLVDAMSAAAAACRRDEMLEGEATRLTDAIEKWHSRPVSVAEAEAVAYPCLGSL